jgi:hypothetical protein
MLSVLGGVVPLAATVLAGIVALLVVVLVVIHVARPDLLRLEHVGLTARSALLDALERRLASLEQKAPSDLAQLPESVVERTQLDGREVFFRTTRERLDNGDLRIIMVAGVREEARFFVRPFGVAARGFDVSVSGVRSYQSEQELDSLAIELGSSPLYER